MIQKVKILIVEDEFIVAEDIRINLLKLDYEVTDVVRSGETAIAAFEKDRPDIVLMDVRLGDGMDGIAAAAHLRSISNVPLIYLTAHSDKATFDRARKTAPHAYIVKPFNFHNLHTAIELALANFAKKQFGQPEDLMNGSAVPQVSQYLFHDSVFVKFGKAFHKIKFSDICFIKANGSYSVVQTFRREFTLSMNLHTLLDRLQRPEFLRVHRSYVVNLNCIDSIDERGIHMDKHFIPVSKSSREELLNKLKAL